MYFRFLHPLNALSSIAFTPALIIISLTSEFSNAYAPIASIESDKTILSKAEFSKAASHIILQLSCTL